MGGGVIRTAAKAAILGGYRTAEAAAAIMGARTSMATVLPASSDSPSVALVSSESIRSNSIMAPEIQRPVCELNDWELTRLDEEEEIFEALHQSPRSVFGLVPSLEETKEATSDLKEAIEKVYFSVDSAKESVNSQGSTPSESSVAVPTIPKHVVHAFSLLQGNPEVQDVVASIAADNNVWDAVMKNNEVMKFCKNYDSAALPPERCVAEESEEILETPNKETSSSKGGGGSLLSKWANGIKLGVSEIVTNISDLLKEFMGGPSSSTKEASSNAEPYVIGSSLLALAVGVILVVLVKRGA